MSEILEAIKAILTWLGIIFEGMLGWFGIPVSIGVIEAAALFLLKAHK